MSNNEHNSKAKARILIVDDEKDITTVLEMGLRGKGFGVTAYTDPEKALADYKPGEYDLLLLDIRMSPMTGFELYRKIHKLDPKVKICFITAYEIYYDEFRRVFPKIKVSCFVKKPVTIDVLSRIVEEELGLASIPERVNQ